MKKCASTALMLAALAGLSPGSSLGKFDNSPKPPTYPFTKSEIEKLSELSGKEKKLYLKSLKEKYS